MALAGRFLICYPCVEEAQNLEETKKSSGLKWLEKSTPKSLSTHDLKVPWHSSAWLIIYFYSLWLTHPRSISYFCGNVSLQDDPFNAQFKCPLILHCKQLGHQHLLIFGASWKVIVYSKSARASHLRNLRCFLTRTCLIALQRHLLGGHVDAWTCSLQGEYNKSCWGCHNFSEDATVILCVNVIKSPRIGNAGN